MEIEISQRLTNFVIFLPFFFISLAVHEFAHAYFANRFGDNTAQLMGRLTLNPLKHIDLIGSVLMPLAAFVSGFALIGWAKPVPVNPSNFRNPRRDDAIVSFAGPMSNFILALVFLAVFAALFYGSFVSGSFRSTALTVITYAVYLNIFLFAFNLLPIPPLDGSHILYDLFPNELTAKIRSFGLYGAILLMVFIYSPLWKYFRQLVEGILSLLFRIIGIET